jgi:hypothetical protein
MAVMLVLLKERNVKCTVEMDSGGMIYMPSLMMVGSGIRVILRTFSTLRGNSVGITDERNL